MRNALLCLALAAAPAAAQDWKTIIVPAAPQAAAEAAAAVDRAMAMAPDAVVSLRNTPIEFGMVTVISGYAGEKLTSVPDYGPKDVDRVLNEKEAFWTRCRQTLSASGPTDAATLEDAGRAMARHSKRLNAVRLILDDISADKRASSAYMSGKKTDVQARLTEKIKTFEALSR